MSGFVGWYNNFSDIDVHKKTIKKMNKTLNTIGNKNNYYISKNILLGYNEKITKYKDYTIVYSGRLYGADELKKDLIEKGFEFDTNSDDEIILKGYVHYKEKILDLLEGVYSFAIYDGNKVFLARDRLGFKPLFYTVVDNNLIFSSEIKGILAHPLVDKIINIQGLTEILSLSPSRIPSSGIFKNIYEVKPAHYIVFKKSIKEKRYWNVTNKISHETFEECTSNVRNILENSIKKQMKGKIGTLLSGGIDSSIITAVCSNEYQKANKKLNTYSLDYEGNDKFFSKNEYQVSRDNYYIDLMKNKYGTNHKNYCLSQRKLASTLKQAVVARDLPGMADIDSSLYSFSKKIRKHNKIVLSGEGADEIFAGYPWFYKEVVHESFPWIKNINKRESLLNKDIRKKMNLKEFNKKYYLKTIEDVPKVKDEKEQYYKNLFYLNMVWFGPALLERKDRMTRGANLEARVPFCDHNLIEYLWNVPWEYKSYGGTEKGLLREAFKDLLPEEIVDRKKNPFPKTHNPKYSKIVCSLLKKRLRNKNSILYKIFDINKINELISTRGESYKTPWFGQLMSGPQLIAFIYQIDIWAELYNIKFEI